MNQKNINKIFAICVLVYAIIVFITIYNHEQWRDEGGDWITLRDINFHDLVFVWLRQAGHSPLFFLILFPFAKMGLPLTTVSWFSGLALVASVSLFIFKTKIPNILKFTILGSYFFIYEYAVIGRPYCLPVFFVALIATLYPKRFEKPWWYAFAIVGLFNSDTLVYPFACALTGMYFLEMLQYKKVKMQFVLPFLIMVIGGAYLIPYIALPGMKLRTEKMLNGDPIDRLKSIVGNALFLWNNSIYAMLLLVALVVSLISRPKAMLLMLGGTLGIIYIFTFKYLGDMRHHGMIVVILVAAYAFAEHYRQDTNEPPFLPNLPQKLLLGGEILFAIILFFQVRVSAATIEADISGNFTGGKDAANFLMENKLENKILIGHTSWGASCVLTYLPKTSRMFYPDCDRYGTYIIYDSLYEANQFAFDGNYAPYVAQTKFKDSLDKVLLMMNMSITDPQFQNNWKAIYITQDEPICKL